MISSFWATVLVEVPKCCAADVLRIRAAKYPDLRFMRGQPVVSKPEWRSFLNGWNVCAQLSVGSNAPDKVCGGTLEKRKRLVDKLCSRHLRSEGVDRTAVDVRLREVVVPSLFVREQVMQIWYSLHERYLSSEEDFEPLSVCFGVRSSPMNPSLQRIASPWVVSWAYRTCFSYACQLQASVSCSWRRYTSRRAPSTVTSVHRSSGGKHINFVERGWHVSLPGKFVFILTQYNYKLHYDEDT